ncbi:hypothetical protein L9F63_004165, partial [Diploptera punctata]
YIDLYPSMRLLYRKKSMQFKFISPRIAPPDMSSNSVCLIMYIGYSRYCHLSGLIYKYFESYIFLRIDLEVFSSMEKILCSKPSFIPYHLIQLATAGVFNMSLFGFFVQPSKIATGYQLC